MAKNKKNRPVTMTKYEITNVRMRRFMAAVIDWYLTSMIVALPITFYLRGDSYLKSEMFDLTKYSFPIGLSLGIFGIVIGIVYYVLVPSFVWKGQTLGKRICKVKVTDIYGQDVSFKTIAIRELLGATIVEGGIVITAAYFRKLLPLFGLANLVEPLTYIAYAMTILSIGYAYFQPLSTCFHDKIAKTIVVKNK